MRRSNKCFYAVRGSGESPRGGVNWTHFVPLCLTLLAACSDCGGTVGTRMRCSTNADCDPGEICIDSYCQFIPDGGESPDCVDLDGDRYGMSCVRGDDCDDTDPTQTGSEICGDGVDNDCDSNADENMSECGTCSPYCSTDDLGRGTDTPFDLGRDESEGVSIDPEGALVLDSREVDTHFIWIADSPDGTVWKIDTRTYTPVARYTTGPAGSGNDPSRTSVNSLGDVYVGNRAGRSVTKISALGAECPDTNGDGMVTTSTGPGDVLAWGMDDCVLWHTSLPDADLIRSVAAQDVEGLDFTVDSFVWIGAWNRNVYKLDGDTGAIAVQVVGPVNNYGFALDGVGNLWISGRGSSELGLIETLTCTGPGACTMSTFATHTTYGITVDFRGRVWTANHGSATISRFDPMTRTFVHTNVGANCHGIAADGVGFVWAACDGQGVVRLNADDPAMFTAVPGTNSSAKGMAVDFDGKIWSVNQTSFATVITPGPTLAEATATSPAVSGFVQPYTYSDMTGQQLRLATNPRGYYRHVIEGCPTADEDERPVWQNLTWEAEVPATTQVIFRVRTADDRTALAAATWIIVAMVPPNASPADIAAALTAAGIAHGRFLEIEVILTSERGSTTMVVTPRVFSFGVARDCPPSID
jgi:hypothetical protein